MIVAFDPGKVTGWAWSINASFDSGQLTGLGEVWDFLKVCDGFEHVTVIYEVFGAAHRYGKFDPSPLEVVGLLKLWCGFRNIKPTLQTPAQAKHFFTNDRLKELGVYKRGQPHAMDALRHLLYFVEFGRRGSSSRRAAKSPTE